MNFQPFLWRSTNLIPPTTKYIRRCFCTTFRKNIIPEELNIGQPTPYTHPHLFKSKLECTPGITHDEYKSRRVNLMRNLSETRAAQAYERQVLILSASELKIMSNDIPYPFHQDTDFLYLTGLNEPDAIVVLEFSKPDTIKYLLFVQPKNPARELWDGAVAGEHAAVDYFNADEAFPLRSFHSIFQERYGQSRACIWVKRGKDVNRKNAGHLVKTLQSKHYEKCSVEDVRMTIQTMRSVKSVAESNLMRASSSIAAKAFKEVMKNTKPDISEAQLHALLDYNCRALGAQHLSFPPVVAAGSRANTLHYIDNNSLMSEGDIVLMDGGCVFNGYASDVTRTWPTSGTFSKPQAELYEVVLRVLKSCIERCTKEVSLNHLHGVMLTLLGQELQEMGLIDPKLTKDVELQRAAADFCPHHLGHYLGMDTHDCPLLHRGIALKVGMAFTLEPGLYIPENSMDVPREYRGIGIRIEDDVLMTGNGPFVMTGEVPKEIDDIEKLMSNC